jgi:hypothetical protein
MGVPRPGPALGEEQVPTYYLGKGPPRTDRAWRPQPGLRRKTFSGKLLQKCMENRRRAQIRTGVAPIRALPPHFPVLIYEPENVAKSHDIGDSISDPRFAPRRLALARRDDPALSTPWRIPGRGRGGMMGRYDTPLGMAISLYTNEPNVF